MPKRNEFLVVVLLVVLTMATFWSVLSCQFISFDDPTYVTENPQVRQGLTSQSLAWAFTTGYASNWHPVTWVSHMVDCELYGSKAGGHHLTNVLLHAANVNAQEIDLNLDEIFEAYVIGRRKEVTDAQPDLERVA